MKLNKLAAFGIGLGAAGVTLGLAAAQAQGTAADGAQPGAVAATQDSSHKGGSGETPLTGSDAEKATEAALAAVPGGTIIRVETDSDGVYEAHVQKADGTQVVVAMDAGFNVTGVSAGGGHGHRGSGETHLTGSDAEKATEAALAAVPGGTIIRVETDSDGVYEAHVQKADGTQVVVAMDAGFNVTGVGAGGGHGHHGGIDGSAGDSSTESPTA